MTKELKEFTEEFRKCTNCKSPTYNCLKDDCPRFVKLQRLIRRVPRRPELAFKFFNIIAGQCPFCGFMVFHSEKECKHCGQAIAWEGVQKDDNN